MKINNQDLTVDELIKHINYDDFKLKDNGRGILLNNHQIEVLKVNGFDYTNYSNLSELIFDVDNYLNSGYDSEELEQVIEDIAEFHYYNETKK